MKFLEWLKNPFSAFSVSKDTIIERERKRVEEEKEKFAIDWHKFSVEGNPDLQFQDQYSKITGRER